MDLIIFFNWSSLNCFKKGVKRGCLSHNSLSVYWYFHYIYTNCSLKLHCKFKVIVFMKDALSRTFFKTKQVCSSSVKATAWNLFFSIKTGSPSGLYLVCVVKRLCITDRHVHICPDDTIQLSNASGNLNFSHNLVQFNWYDLSLFSKIYAFEYVRVRIRFGGFFIRN